VSAYAAVMTGTHVAPRRSLIADVVLAAGLTAFIMVGTFFASQGQPARRPFDVGTAVLLIAAAGPLALRRRHPVAVLAVVLGVVLVYQVIGYANGPIWLPLIVAYFTAVVRGHRLAAAITGVVGVGVFPWLDYWLRDQPAPSFVGMAALAAWLLVLLGSAEAVRIRRERAAEAIRIREEEALRRASEERLRIARELHDALGHHLSLITVQSGVALHLNEELPHQARSSLVTINQASKEGLAELRSVLDILRQKDDQALRSPTSTLARLDELISQASAAGLQVRTETNGNVRPVPFGIDVAAFRILQEALTNVSRHAGAASATVRVSYGERDLVLQVDDNGAGGRGDGTAGGGKGILGMRERAAALGGDLEAGPRSDGGFRVWARLPLGGST
jgi:signal transduction histidine kinase